MEIARWRWKVLTAAIDPNGLCKKFAMAHNQFVFPLYVLGPSDAMLRFPARVSVFLPEGWK